MFVITYTNIVHIFIITFHRILFLLYLSYKPESRSFDFVWCHLYFVFLILYSLNTSGRTMNLESTQLLPEMSIRNIFCYMKAASEYGRQSYHLQTRIFLKSGDLNSLETSGTIHACVWKLHIFFPLPFTRSCDA